MRITVEKTQVDSIFDTLLDRISVGKYPEGHILHEISLGAEFEVSRTPIRQALQRLAFEKFIRIRKGVGNIVIHPKISDILRSMEIRARVLDIVIDLDVAHSDYEFYEQLLPIASRAKKLIRQPNNEQYWIINKQLHKCFNNSFDDYPLRQMDNLLFNRVSPQIMATYDRDPKKSIDVLNEDLESMLVPADIEDTKQLLKIRQDTIRKLAVIIENQSNDVKRSA